MSWGRFVGRRGAVPAGVRGRLLTPSHRLAAIAALLAATAAGVLAWQADSAGADASCAEAPTNLTADLGDDGTSVELAWEASICDPVTYAVYRRTMTDPASRMTLFDTVEGTVLTYADTTVEAGSTYRYRIRSNNQGRRSGYAEVAVPEQTSAEPDAGSSEGPDEQAEPTERSTFPRNVVSLVSNRHLTGGGGAAIGGVSGSENRAANAFTTGSADGYTLTEVVLRLATVEGTADATVTINASNGSSPGDVLYTLTDPATLTQNAANTFTAPDNAVLEPSTSYYLVIANSTTGANNEFQVRLDEGDAETGQSGWSIANGYRLHQANSSIVWDLQTLSLLFELKGEVRTNNAASGAPTISGTATVGETLTAATSGITDADGLVDVSYSYQWLRVDSMSNETEIGSDSSSYTLVDADAGNKIKVKVTFTDDEGFAEELTSAAYPATGTIAAATPANAAPTFDEGSSTTRSVPENSAAGTNVGAAVEAMDTDTADTLTYSLGGDDASSFDFETSTGQIKTKSGVTYDFEGTNEYSVTVGVRDSKDADGNADTYEDASIAVTIELSDVNEAPAITSTGSSHTSPSVAENTQTSTVVATYTATDPDAADSTLVWSLTGTDAGDFTITRNTDGDGELKFASTPNYESKSSYSLTVNVRDGRNDSGGSDSAVDDSLSVTVTVTDVNEAPAITTRGSSHTAPSVAENSPTSTVVATYTAADPDPADSTLTWWLTGTDASDFTITRNTDGDGELKFVNSPNYESKSSYSLTVNVRDGRNDSGGSDSAVDDSLSVTVGVTNEDEAGTVTVTGTPAGGVELTASLSDIDGSETSVSWQWARAEPGTDSFSNISGATMATYRPGAADVGKILRATARYTDGHGSGKTATSSATGTVSASNTNPEFSAETAAREVPENSAPLTAVGAPVSTTDNEGDSLTYSLASTGDGSSFTIDATTGQIRTKSGITYDFESSKKSYSVTVNVRDSKDIAGDSDSATDDSIAVTISLTDVNEAPTITNPPRTASVAENTPAATVIVTFAASDVDASDTEEWSVESADDGALFEIHQTSGALTFKESPDFETRRDADGDNVYKVTVKVTDSGGLSATTAMTPLLVTVTNINEPPEITSTGSTHTEPSFDENGTAVVATYTATDMDASTVLTWTLEGNDAEDFTITKNADGDGELKFKVTPNYEDPADADTNNEYQVTVKVTDNHSGMLEDTVSVVVTVNDVNERPVVSGAVGPSFDEFRFDLDPSDLEPVDYVVATYTAVDDDPDDSVEWTLTGPDAEHFSVTAAGSLLFNIAPETHDVTGELTPRPDYERPDDAGGNNVYNVTVVATDTNADDSGHSPLMGTFDVTVTVTSVNEGPVILDDNLDFSFAEIAYDAPRPVHADDRIVASLSVYDEEDDDVDCSLLGVDAGSFSIAEDLVNERCVLSFTSGNEPDYENPVDDGGDRVYDLQIGVSAGRMGPDYDVTVTVTDVDETPEVTGPADQNSFQETEYDSYEPGMEPDVVVATFEARDEEGEVIDWTLSGEDANDFDITKNAAGEGVVTFKNPPNYEQPTDGPADQNSDNVYKFTVEATDAADPDAKTGSWNYQVTVIDVNERPEFTGTPPTAITYDENDTVVVASYSARDEEGGVTWSLTGIDSGDFSIDSGGTVTFNSTPDWEDPDDDGGDNVYQFTVVATDVELMTSPRRDARREVTVTVADVEEPGAIEVSNLNPSVADLDAILFTLSDPDGGIVLAAGVLSWRIERRLPMQGWETIVTGGPLSLTTGYGPDEDDTGYEIRAVATYTDRRGSGKTAESEPTAAVTADPIVNAPPRVTAGTCDVPEGPGGRNICSPTSATDRDGDSLTFALANEADAARFEVHASSGQLRAIAALDFETTVGPILVPVHVADGRDADDNVETDFVADVSATFAINILDVEEDGVVTLSNTDPAVGDTVTASLSDGDGSISSLGWQWARSVNGRTNWVNITGAASPSYSVRQHDANFFLRATASYDDNRGDDKRAESVTAQPVFSDNQRPSFPSTESGQRTVTENARGANVGAPVTAIDPERDRLTYSLDDADADAAAFTIVQSTGQIRTKEPLDFESKSSYTFTVEVHDGKDGQGNASTAVDDTVDVTVTVVNAEEPGEITLTTLTATISARVRVTAMLNDPDGSISNLTWQWTRSPNGRSGWVIIGGATGPQYTPTLEADAGNFLRATATYTDGHGTETNTAEKVSTRVGQPPPINAAPAFGATEDGRRSIAEDAGSGDPIGDPVAADDFNNDTLSYSVGGTDAASFDIDASTGQLRLASGVQLDFETKRSYRVVVSVSDGADPNDDPDNAVDDTITVTITVTDVNEAPVLTGDTSPVVAENTRSAVATFRGADPERDTLDWTVSNDAFWISGQGQLWFVSPPSFEDGTSHRVTVEATDPEGLSDTLDVTVTVTDVEEQGTVRVTPLRGWVGTRFTATLTDDDGSTSGIIWQWSRSRSRSGGDDIPNATSASYTATDDDIGHFLRVTASYSDRRGSNKEASAALTARIAGAVERPSSNTAPEFADTSVTRSVGGGTAPGRAVGPPVRAEDAENDDVLSYALSGVDAELFDIDPATGQLRTKGVLDPDVQNTYTVVVEVNDGFDGSYDPSDSTDDTVEVTIAITALSTQRGTFGGGFGGGGSGGGGSGGGGGDLDIGVATFVVANGWSPADVGTASVLAARTLGAVVLYTAGDDLSPETAELLREAQPAQVLIVGGTAAVSTGVRSQIRAASGDSGLVRITGQDRADTAAAAARRVLGLPPDAGSVTLVIANGWSPPDIGAAAALAARSGRAAVAYTQRDALPEPTAALLRDYEIARVFIVGGTAAISDAVAQRIAVLAPDATVTRLVGTDRIDTAAQAARRVLGSALGAPRDITLVIANGWSPPDAGVAAAFAAATDNAAVAYTARDTLPDATAALIRDYRPARVIILGGRAAVSDDVRTAISQVAADTTVIQRITGDTRTDTAARAAHRILRGP